MSAPLKTLLMANSIASLRCLQERMPVSSYCPALSASRDRHLMLTFVCGWKSIFSFLLDGQRITRITTLDTAQYCLLSFSLDGQRIIHITTLDTAQYCLLSFSLDGQRIIRITTLDTAQYCLLSFSLDGQRIIRITTLHIAQYCLLSFQRRQTHTILETVHSRHTGNEG